MVDGDGYYSISIKLIDNEDRITYYKKSDLKVSIGWNFVAVYWDDIYEFTYMTMYSRNEDELLMQ